jgi:hypothetical protein
MTIIFKIKVYDYGWWKIIYLLNIFCNWGTFCLSDK